MPVGRKSSGLWPAEASSPIAPEILESTTQKSPCGVDSTRGARSRSCAGACDVHRSFGGFTCGSAEMMRSFAMGRPPSWRRVINRPGSGGPPGSGRDARLERLEGLAAPAGRALDDVGDQRGDLVLLLGRPHDTADRLQLLGDHLEGLHRPLPVAGALGRGELPPGLADQLLQLGRGRRGQVVHARPPDGRVHYVEAAADAGKARPGRVRAAGDRVAAVVGAGIAVVAAERRPPHAEAAGAALDAVADVAVVAVVWVVIAVGVAGTGSVHHA